MDFFDAVVLGFLLLFMARPQWVQKPAMISLAFIIMVLRVLLLAVTSWIQAIVVAAKDIPVQSQGFALTMEGIQAVLPVTALLVTLLAFRSAKDLASMGSDVRGATKTTA